jgi:hypothetical protein
MEMPLSQKSTSCPKSICSYTIFLWFMFVKRRSRLIRAAQPIPSNTTILLTNETVRGMPPLSVHGRRGAQC